MVRQICLLPILVHTQYTKSILNEALARNNGTMAMVIIIFLESVKYFISYTLFERVAGRSFLVISLVCPIAASLWTLYFIGTKRMSLLTDIHTHFLPM